MGAAIARSAWPSRLARDGTLIVNTADSIWAFELAHRAAEIAGRLGVEKVRFAPGPLAVAPEERPPIEAPVPSAEQARQAAELAAPITDENLRKTVEKAISLSLAGGPRDRPV